MNNYTLFLLVFYKSGKSITFKCFNRILFHHKHIYLFYDKDYLFDSYRRKLDLSKIDYYYFYYRKNEYGAK